MSAPRPELFGETAMRRALSATPEQRARLGRVLDVIAPPPTPCPQCGGAMGDGDRVTAGRCAMCRRGGRR